MRAPAPYTADLFAAADAASHPAIAPASVPAPALAPVEIAPTTTAARLRSTPLWYAVVFAELCVHERPAAELQRLCVQALQFTSWVSIEMPNALLLELRGSVKLFGSIDKLHADIDGAWSALKRHARSATAPSPLAALWLARAGKRAIFEDPGLLASELAELPIACTCWDAERLHLLRTLGVSRVGELLRLPRAGLARRLTPAAVSDIDIALARQAAPRRAFVMQERFRERCDFEFEIETVAYLQKALEPLLGRCADFLRERQAGVQAFELRLRHRVEPGTRIRFGLADITGEYRRLTDVLTQKLSALELKAAVQSMELRSGALQPLSSASLDAFAAGGRGGGRDTAPQLVERLRARLGERSIYGLCTFPEHRPEAAWRRIHELRLDSAAYAAGRKIFAGAATDVPRPVWLLDEPVAFSPAQLQQLHQGELILEEGPERIESGWWDGKDVARDYYIARQTGGMRRWVFQERSSKRWYLHGVFA